MSDTTELGLARRARTTEDLPIFAQREASPEVERPRARVEMRSGRERAKEQAERTLPRREALIVASLTAYGPQNRAGLSTLAGLSENSTNSACHSLLAKKVLVVVRYEPESGRGVLDLASRHPLTETP